MATLIRRIRLSSHRAVVHRIITSVAITAILVLAHPTHGRSAYASSLPCTERPVPTPQGYLSTGTLPIWMTTPSSVTGGNSFTCTIGVDVAPEEDSYVQVTTDHPEIASAPSSWTYNLAMPSGATQNSFTVTTSTVTSNTVVKIISCERNKDISNPANWRVVGTLTVLAP